MPVKTWRRRRWDEGGGFEARATGTHPAGGLDRRDDDFLLWPLGVLVSSQPTGVLKAQLLFLLFSIQDNGR